MTPSTSRALPEQQSDLRKDWLFAGSLAMVHACLVRAVYRYVPDPYMDEIFHIPQTRRYCVGNWSWDPMITTPPALYVIGMPFCGLERYTNSLLLAWTFIGFCRFRRMFHKDCVHSSALAALLLPVLLHSSLLYYTDLLSVCAVVWGFSVDSPLFSSLLFGVSVLTRQTNIIWAGFSAAVRFIRDVDTSRTVSSVVQSLLRLSSFIVLALSFAVFLLVNGGIVLGDASAHEPRLHLAQFLYFGVFAAVHAWPQAIPRIRVLLSKLIHPIPALLVIPVVLSAQYFAVGHLYLLSDNRHVTFYLWRWWLSEPTRRVLLTPLFIASFIYLCDLSTHLSPFVRVLSALCSFVVVVPAPLIELRYFIVPYVLWRLSAKTSSSNLIVVAELLSQLFVFLAVFLLFLFKPFEWTHEPGVQQRFMW